jgi:hypothetical protein
MRLLLGPGGWLIAQVLLLIHDSLDNGSNNCGLSFQFDNPKSTSGIKRKYEWLCNLLKGCCSQRGTPDSSYQNEDTVYNDNLNTHEDIKRALLQSLFMDKVHFKSENGRYTQNKV